MQFQIPMAVLKKFDDDLAEKNVETAKTKFPSEQCHYFLVKRTISNLTWKLLSKTYA